MSLWLWLRLVNTVLCSRMYNLLLPTAPMEWWQQKRRNVFHNIIVVMLMNCHNSTNLWMIVVFTHVIATPFKASHTHTDTTAHHWTIITLSRTMYLLLSFYVLMEFHHSIVKPGHLPEVSLSVDTALTFILWPSSLRSQLTWGTTLSYFPNEGEDSKKATSKTMVLSCL